MRTVKVNFENGNSITTSINGSRGDILAYYRVGRLFNIGNGPNDELSAVASVEFLEESVNPSESEMNQREWERHYGQKDADGYTPAARRALGL